MPLAAILLSHLPTQCCGKDLPISVIRDAADFCADHDFSLVVSVGQHHWDYVLFAAIERRVPIHLIMVKNDIPVWKQWQITPVSCEIVETAEQRDKRIIEKAETIFPVWIRPKGRLTAILAAMSSGKIIDKRFDCSAYRFSISLKYPPFVYSSQLVSLPDLHLWHWTRSSVGKWEEETPQEFCRDVLSSQIYPRNAFETLKRIVQTRRICGCGEHIVNHIPVVSFTQNHPAKNETMLQWRTGKHRMNFEPYAIGIPRESVAARGGEPVIYGNKPDWNTMRKNAVWKNENEWRKRGDLVIDDNIFKEMIIIIYKNEETKEMQKIFAGKIVPFCEE
ncbi:MAG: hypothetical protein LBJ67_09750 [Planctomycetaceae bacterium]|jgi:hypothetical protein|nr:hypothetical protein [Planctomycetaceae bacterium]